MTLEDIFRVNIELNDDYSVISCFQKGIRGNLLFEITEELIYPYYQNNRSFTIEAKHSKDNKRSLSKIVSVEFLQRNRHSAIIDKYIEKNLQKDMCVDYRR